ncbi:hypothetical protein [Mycolicibacterium fortuitum]
MSNVIDLAARRERPDIYVRTLPPWDKSDDFADNNHSPMLMYDPECGWLLVFFGEDVLDPKWYEPRVFAPDHIHDPLVECPDGWTPPWDALAEWVESRPVELEQALSMSREHLKGFVQTQDAETGRPIFERPEGYIEPDYDG